MTAKQVLNAQIRPESGPRQRPQMLCAMDATERATSSYGNECAGRDYSWGVGSVETLTIAGCNKALSAARQQADRILDLIAAGADPCWHRQVGEAPPEHSQDVHHCSGMSVSNMLLDKGDEWSSSETYRDNYLNGLEIHCQWLMDSPSSRHQSGYGHRGHPTSFGLHQALKRHPTYGKAAVSHIQLR